MAATISRCWARSCRWRPSSAGDGAGRGRAERIELTYYGLLADYDTRLLTAAGLNGAFQGRFEQPVNYVNAPLLADERGIEVVEQRRRASRDFTNLVRVSVGTNGEQLRVSGTTIGRDDRMWLVSALGFELEMGSRPCSSSFATTTCRA